MRRAKLRRGTEMGEGRGKGRPTEQMAEVVMRRGALRPIVCICMQRRSNGNLLRVDALQKLQACARAQQLRPMDAWLGGHGFVYRVLVLLEQLKLFEV